MEIAPKSKDASNAPGLGPRATLRHGTLMMLSADATQVEASLPSNLNLMHPRALSRPQPQELSQ